MKIGALILALVFLVSGCSIYPSISKIKDDPQKYEDKKISIKGKVVETIGIPLIQNGIFQMDDGTGTIWIVSEKRRPARGDKVTVKGIVKTGFSFNERSFGTVIIEAEKK